LKCPNLTPLLIRARERGLRLTVDGQDLVYTPRWNMTPEVQAELLKHKPVLVDLLTWRESEAHKLVKDALSYLAEFYHKASSPDCHLGAMLDPEDLINEAFGARDMHLLRVAVRQWVEVGLEAFQGADRDRGAA
jgi:hypothetical protein